jgi:DNA-binding NarL/FixJ family response regulator
VTALPPRVVVVDDHPEVLRGVKRLLALECDVVGVVSDADELMETVRRLQPDVVVIDVHLHNVDGIEACHEILQWRPETKVIMFTALDEPAIRQRSFEQGASAFVHKLVPEDLLLAIQRVRAERD